MPMYHGPWHMDHGPFGCLLGSFWAPFCCFGRVLGSFLGVRGLCINPAVWYTSPAAVLGVVLGGLGVVLGAFWVSLGSFWAPFCCFGGVLGSLLGVRGLCIIAHHYITALSEYINPYVYFCRRRHNNSFEQHKNSFEIHCNTASGNRTRVRCYECYVLSHGGLPCH